MANFGFANKSNSSDFSLTGDKVNEVFGDLLLNRTELEAMITSLRRRQYGATPPASPNTGDVWECSTTGGGYTAGIVYRYNGSAWAELIASAVNIPNRNTVIQGKVTAAGLPDLFEAGTGLAVKLNATATPAIFAFMNGNSTSLGTVDIVAAVSADAATFWSSLPTSSTVYLYVDYTAGTVSGGFTTVAPVYQNIAPTHSAGLHWLDFNTGKVWSSDGSAWTQKNRIFVGTATTDGSGVTAVDVYAYNAIQTLQANDIITKGPHVDARAFGAVPGAENSNAIQAAIDSMTTGGTLLIPSSKLNKKIIVTNSNITITSTGQISYDIAGFDISLNEINMFTVPSGVSNVRFMNLSFDGYFSRTTVGQALSSSVVVQAGASKVIVSGCYFINQNQVFSGSPAVHFRSGSAKCLCINNIFDNIDTVYSGGGGYVSSGTNNAAIGNCFYNSRDCSLSLDDSHNDVVIGNTFKNTVIENGKLRAAGNMLQVAHGSTNFIVSDNVIYGVSGGCGIQVWWLDYGGNGKTHDGLIANNIIDCGGDEYTLKHPVCGLAVSSDCYRITVKNNTIRNGPPTGTTPPSYGMGMSMRNNQVVDNKILWPNCDSAIFMTTAGTDTGDLLIDGNEIHFASRAIYFPDSADAYAKTLTLCNNIYRGGGVTSSLWYLQADHLYLHIHNEDINDATMGEVLNSTYLGQRALDSHVSSKRPFVIDSRPGQTSRFVGSASPASGEYRLGDVVANDMSSTKACIGWVCTVAGEPGTWQPFGVVGLDYEKGTWTTAYTPESGAFGTCDTAGGGTYIKIGDLVELNFTLYTSQLTKSTASGNLTITGLPFVFSGGVAVVSGAWGWITLTPDRGSVVGSAIQLMSGDTNITVANMVEVNSNANFVTGTVIGRL